MNGKDEWAKAGADYYADPTWRQTPLTPAQTERLEAARTEWIEFNRQNPGRGLDCDWCGPVPYSCDHCGNPKHWDTPPLLTSIQQAD